MNSLRPLQTMPQLCASWGCVPLQTMLACQGASAWRRLLLPEPTSAATAPSPGPQPPFKVQLANDKGSTSHWSSFDKMTATNFTIEWSDTSADLYDIALLQDPLAVGIWRLHLLAAHAGCTCWGWLSEAQPSAHLATLAGLITSLRHHAATGHRSSTAASLV